VFLARAISFFADFFRGRGYYHKYKKMYKYDLREIPSFKLISNLAHGRILDIGCGIGYLSSLFEEYVGIDVNKKAINIAKKNTSGDYISASATDLPFPNHVFGTCVSYDFIEHTKNVKRVLAEMKRVSDKVIISCVDFSSYYRLFTYDKTHEWLPKPNGLLLTLGKQFTYVRLFRTSGLFMVPYFLNTFLSRCLPNQVVLEAFSRQTYKRAHRH
jgi:ubiquinone/menaquinone biosynthesis C-methylase UbiE